MREVRIRTIPGFCCANLGSELCAIILGSRTQTSDPRICCANLRSARNLLGSRNQTSAIRGNKPTIDRARKAARHTRQRSHDRSRTQSSSAYASTKPRSIAHAKQLDHRGKEAMIDRARKSARPSAAMNPRCRGWRS